MKIKIKNPSLAGLGIRTKLITDANNTIKFPLEMEEGNDKNQRLLLIKQGLRLSKRNSKNRALSAKLRQEEEDNYYLYSALLKGFEEGCHYGS